MTTFLLRDTIAHRAIWLLILVLIEQRGLRTSVGGIRLSFRSILLIFVAKNIVENFLSIHKREKHIFRRVSRISAITHTLLRCYFLAIL